MQKAKELKMATKIPKWLVQSLFKIGQKIHQWALWNSTLRLCLLTLKEPGAESTPPRHFLLYLSRLLFFRAETSWLFFFKPCAWFKTIFRKIEPRVMTRRCVIERWVQRKIDQKLIFNGNYTQIVLFVFRMHFHYVLSYLFGLFGVRTCVSILWHTSQLLLEKIAKNHDFGDFWWFSCFWHDVTVASYKVCLYFFGTNGLGRVIAIH